MFELLGDQLRALLIISSVHDRQTFVRFGAPVDAGRSRVQVLTVGACREIASGAVGGFQPNLSRSFQLWRVGIQWPFAFPEVEDAFLLLLHRFAPVSGRQGAI